MVIMAIYLYLVPNLPDTEALRDIELQTPLRVYASDGLLISEFGEKRRNPISYADTPPLFIQALLASEDDGFFEHSGIDLKGLTRAAVELVRTGKKKSGGSTITMQVAKNYYLSSEKTFTRKFTEILLALKIEQSLSKEEGRTQHVQDFGEDWGELRRRFELSETDSKQLVLAGLRTEVRDLVRQRGTVSHIAPKNK